MERGTASLTISLGDVAQETTKLSAEVAAQRTELGSFTADVNDALSAMETSLNRYTADGRDSLALTADLMRGDFAAKISHQQVVVFERVNELQVFTELDWVCLCS